MVFASTSVIIEEQAPKTGCCRHLCPQEESELPPASLGYSLRSASGSDPGSFQTTASALGLGACEILCMPFKYRVSISYSPPALLFSSSAGLQSQMF